MNMVEIVRFLCALCLVSGSTLLFPPDIAEGTEAGIVANLTEDAWNGWTSQGNYATDLPDSSGSGTWNVVWYDNLNITQRYTMRCWAYPDSGTPKVAWGYSWNGTHDTGWSAYVGFETMDPATGVLKVRSNGVSASCMRWRSGVEGQMRFTLTLFNAGNLPGPTWEGSKHFGIYRISDGTWMGDTTYNPINGAAYTGAGPVVVTFTDFVSVGDRYLFVFRSSGGNGMAAISATVEPANIPPPDWDLYSDSWVATDALGRSLPGYDECSPPRNNRTIGIFYFLWLGQHSTSGPHDITQLLAANPDDPAWGPRHDFHHWGESELGYYLSMDPSVMRKHAAMLTDAGVDTLIIDVTNGFIYEAVYLQLCSIFRQIRLEGGITPSICFIANSDAVNVVSQLYTKFYIQNKYRELWFYWKGKPLILTPLSGHSAEIQNFFTMRYCWTWTGGYDQWNWLDFYPQKYGWHESSAIPEETSVGVAQHPVSNIGRSYQNYSQPPINEYHLTGLEHLGLCFTEQWQRALSLDPEFVFVTGWNEWAAQRFVCGLDGCRFICGPDGCPDFLGSPMTNGQSYFVDAYNQEYSRDIEPMKDGHTDNYYYQMIANIRKYKGVRSPTPASAATSVVIDGDFSDWADVEPEYRDTFGDTQHRDYPGWGTLYYTDTTGRNDIILSKAACDAHAIYFYVKTRDNLTSYSGSRWMYLFIDSDTNHNTGWEGYDYIINHTVNSSASTTLKTGVFSQPPTIVNNNVLYTVSGNQMELRIPREDMGLTGEQVAFDFHWADNIQQENDVVEFALHGDSAPNRRFNYRYDNNTVIPYYILSDRNEDGVADTEDLSIIAGNWLSADPDPKADLTGEGVVNMDDFSLFASGWLESCPPVKEWAFTATTENWIAVNAISGFGWQSGGTIGGTITGTDPYLHSAADLGVSIAAYPYIKVKMKNNTPATTAQLYFITNSSPNWDEAKHADFPIIPNDSHYTEYTVDMSPNANWTGTLKQLRLDPATGVSGGSFSVDSITIGLAP